MSNPIIQPTFRSPDLPLRRWQDDQYNQNLIHGIIDWCTWSMLDLGAYQNVAVSDVNNIYGGQMSTLRPVQDPNYIDGQVWEAIRSDWIWETGVTYSGVAPTVASGVYVNNTFYPSSSTTGIYQHFINFPLGRVIFNNPVSTTSLVNADYSYRLASFVQSKDTWFTQLLYNSFAIQRSDFLSSSGTAFSVLAQARRQMPAVGLELVNRRASIPYELGSLSQLTNQDMLLYIVAENDFDRDQLMDILCAQIDKEVWLLDRASMKNDSRYPMTLDYNGTPVASPMSYMDLVYTFPGVRCRIEGVTSQSMSTINSWLYRGVVRMTFGAIL